MQGWISSRNEGFSLVELTVATAIYSMGLGSLSLMLLLAVRGTSDAGFETTAAVQAASLAEMILMTSDASGHYALPSAPGTGPCDAAQPCSAEEMAAWQLATWQRRLAIGMPAGRGLVCRDATPDDGSADDPACDGEGRDVIKVFWQQPPGAAEAEPVPARQVLRLP